MNKQVTYWFKRDVDEKVKASLFRFIEEFSRDKFSPRSMRRFYKFVLLSFNVKRENRYSVSEFSKVILKTIDQKSSEKLILIYINSLQLLGEEHNIKEFII